MEATWVGPKAREQLGESKASSKTSDEKKEIAVAGAAYSHCIHRFTSIDPPLKWSDLKYVFWDQGAPDFPRKTYKPEEIVAKLRQVDVQISQGQGTGGAVRHRESIAGDVAAAVVGESSSVPKPSMVSDLLAPVYGWFTGLARQVAYLATNFETVSKGIGSKRTGQIPSVQVTPGGED